MKRYDYEDSEFMNRIKIMTFNILKDGLYEQNNRQDIIFEVINKHNPDILCMQEGGDSPFWNDMAQKMQFSHFFNIEGTHAPSIYSKLSINKQKTFYYDRAIYIQLTTSGKTLGVYCLHINERAMEDKIRIRELKTIMQSLPSHNDDFVCFAGDFNSRIKGEWGMPNYLELISKIQGCGPITKNDFYKATEIMYKKGFVDCYRHLHKDEMYSFHPTMEMLNSRASEYKSKFLADFNLTNNSPYIPAGIRFDYIFVNTVLADCLTSCVLDASEKAYLASDHLPIIATFEI